ncbi:MAG TPA: DegT/DnrJ/EryC1/StrS aminotransferase family protein [Beijerinckiaceae bacterium]|jgi:dTDP-4-amino-4,6-dideoxygalactose transaminase
MTNPIPFIDLATQRQRLGAAIDEAMMRVVNATQFMMGPEVGKLEADLAAFCGAKHVISCSNGTDSLIMILMAKGVGPGDAVLCPAFTFAASAAAIARVGATALFLDVSEDTFNLDPESLKTGIRRARELNLRPVGLMSVDLFGQPADYDAIEPICAAEGLWLLSDSAQSFGAAYKGRKVGTIGMATSTSFFPAKPLGCYGDGGAILTDDAELADVLRSIRIHGQGADKYENVRVGMTGRLDTIQAAVLVEKLRIFPDEIEARNRIAKRYNALLADVAIVPEVAEGSTSVWAQYTLRLPGIDRDAFQAHLKGQGIPTAVYYGKPLHRQKAYEHFPAAGGNGLPVAERLATEVVSLPMHPYLSEEVQDRVVRAVKDALAAQQRAAA